MSYPPLPPDTRAVGTGDPANDMNAVVDNITALETAVPYPPGGTTDFLRADGSWADPGGGVSLPLSLAEGGTGLTPVNNQQLLDQLDALDASENLSDLQSVATARANLGLGSAALEDTDGTASDYAPSPGTASAGSVPKVATAGHVHPQPPMFAPTGLTGATSATRYVGATTSGAPGSGTFAVGDFAVAQNGHIWVCTTAGSPGTWTDAGTAGSVVIDSTTGDIAASPGTAAAGSIGKAADAGHVHPQPTNFAPTGVTGATAASKYVGATASGSPGSGTHALGDFTVDQTGSFWICTTAGSPGTWTQVIAGGISGGGTVGVTNGGTGATSLTAYAVLCGGTSSTSAVQPVAALGSAGTVLTSNGAGALPTFQAAGGGGVSQGKVYALALMRAMP